MGENRPNLPRAEGMEEIVTKANELLGRIDNILSAGPRVAGTLVLAFPDKSVGWLAAFWSDIRDAAVDDYKWQCDKMFGLKED